MIARALVERVGGVDAGHAGRSPRRPTSSTGAIRRPPHIRVDWRRHPVAYALAVLALARRWIPDACPRRSRWCAARVRAASRADGRWLYAAAPLDVAASSRPCSGSTPGTRAPRADRRSRRRCRACGVARGTPRGPPRILPFAVVLVDVARGASATRCYSAARAVDQWLHCVRGARFTIATTGALASSLSVRSPLENPRGAGRRGDLSRHASARHALRQLRSDLVAREATDAVDRSRNVHRCVLRHRLRAAAAAALARFLDAGSRLRCFRRTASSRLELPTTGSSTRDGGSRGLPSVALASMSARLIATGVAIGLVAILGVATFVRRGRCEQAEVPVAGARHRGGEPDERSAGLEQPGLRSRRRRAIARGAHRL